MQASSKVDVIVISNVCEKSIFIAREVAKQVKIKIINIKN